MFPYHRHSSKDTLFNKDRILFNCCASEGASGSPGIVIENDEVVVVTVLLRGYPSWYYDPKHSDIRSRFPKDICIEQGANMDSVSRRIAHKNPSLHSEIFPPV